MASSIPKPPSALNCQSYVGLRPPQRTFNFCLPQAATKSFPSRLFVVRASDSDFEAAVVAGNIPQAPPVPPKPAAPVGTPVVPSLVSVFIFFCVTETNSALLRIGLIDLLDFVSATSPASSSEPEVACDAVGFSGNEYFACEFCVSALHSRRLVSLHKVIFYNLGLNCL